MDRYTARITAHGYTQRERNINMLKNNIVNQSQSNPSYKNIILNGVETNLIIDSGTKPYNKQFKSLPGQEINIGDYVEWANNHWLVTECDSDDEIYRNGTLEQCNYLLKWQNEIGEIIERWSIISSASKYNDGTDGGKVIVLGSDQLFVVIPVDAESIKLKKSMGKKFFIDHNTENPTTYELTGTGNVESTYNGHGVTSWIVKECVYKATEDDIEHGIPNYFSSAPISTEDVDTYHMVIDCPIREIKVGKTKTMTSILLDSNSEEVLEESGYVWTISSNIDEYVSKEESGIKNNTCKVILSSNCEDYGEIITVTCRGQRTGFEQSVNIIVVGGY